MGDEEGDPPARQPPSASPIPRNEPPARDPVKGGREDQILTAVIDGDIDKLRQLLDPRSDATAAFTSERYGRAGVRGTLLCHAVYNHRKKAATFLLSLPGTSIAGSEAIFFCVRHCKYDMALFLIAKAGPADINRQRETDGNSVLHVCCARPKPPVQFISELCRLKRLNVNQKNSAGHAPVHLLALHSKGVEGRDAATLLRAKGALLDLRADDGRTALEMCRNSFLREVLGLGTNSNTRQDPSQLLTEEEKKNLDAPGASERIDREIKKLLSDAARAKEVLREEAYQGQGEMRRPIKKIEDVEKLTLRLYTEALDKQMEKKDKMHRDLEKQEKESRKTKKFDDPSEQEDSVGRLYEPTDINGKTRKEKMEELMSKFTENTAEVKQMTPDDLTESIGRLYNTSLDKSKEKQAQLRKKYLENNLEKSRFAGGKMDKEAAAASVGRLYDKAKERQAETLQKMHDKYITANEPKKKKMTEAQRQEVSARLAASK